MGKVEIDHVKLKAAYDGLTGLVSKVKSHATQASNNTPISLPSLTGADFTGLMSFLEDQKPEIKTRLDLAILLDTQGTGKATYDVDQDTLDKTKGLLGNALADRGKDLRAYGDPKFIRAYNDILAGYVNDGKVMSPMFQKLGPEGTLTVLSNIAHKSVPPTGEDLDAKKRLMDLYRTGLGSASKEVGFPADSFGKGLVEAATKKPEDYMGRGTTGYGLTSALGVLMYGGKFSDGLATSLATNLDKYERLDNKGVSGLWGNRPGSEQNFMWDHMLPMEAGNAAKDPMISMNSMLSNSPKAALEFFSDNERQKYYIKERTWGGDQFRSLSQVLNVATTDPSLIKDPAHSKQAAELAGATINLFSGRRETAGDMRTLVDDIDDGAAKNFAHILGTYMVGADHAANHGSFKLGDGVDPSQATTMYKDAFGNVANIPLFDKDALAKFGVVAASSEDGMLELRNSLNRYESQKIGGLAGGIENVNDSAGKDLLKNGLGENARLESLFLKSVGEAAIAEGKNKDEEIGKWVDLGTQVVDLVPIPKIDNMAEGVAKDAVNLALDEGKSAGFDSLKEALAHYEKDAIKDQNEKVDNAVTQQQYFTASVLFEKGLVGDKAAVEGSPMFKDGQMLTYDEFSKLPEADRETAMSLLTSGKGVGNYFEFNEYKEDAHDVFFEAFK